MFEPALEARLPLYYNQVNESLSIACVWTCVSRPLFIAATFSLPKGNLYQQVQSHLHWRELGVGCCTSGQFQSCDAKAPDVSLLIVAHTL